VGRYWQAIAGAGVLTLLGGLLAATATVASAATPPPWEPDPNALGSITFYNSSGQVVTGGTDDSFLADYAQASTVDPTDGDNAFLQFASPQPDVPASNWFTKVASGTTNYLSDAVSASEPAPLNSSENPVVIMSQAAGDADLLSFHGVAPANTAPGYVDAYQVRIVTSESGGPFDGTILTGQYWEDDLLVDPATGSWSVEYAAPTPPVAVTLTASPAVATVGVSETLTARETPPLPGIVDFFDGNNVIGAMFVDSNGVAALNTTFAMFGTHTIGASFAPLVFPAFGGAGAAQQLVVNPSEATTTTLSVSQSGTTGSDVSLSAIVTTAGFPVTAGTVSFYDNGSATPLNPAPVTPDASGVAMFDIPAGLSPGEHSITAAFTPANPAQFDASQSAPQSFYLQESISDICAEPSSQCTDVQNIQATIPIGTLIISTPYTASSPLNFGALALTNGLTAYSGSAAFSNIKVIDTRAGDLPWTITALASNLTDGGTGPGSVICGQDLGLTALTSTPGTGFTGTVTTIDNPPADPPTAPSTTGCPATPGGLVGAGGSAVTIAMASTGLGTDTLNGTANLTAPVSTESGQFTGTITFTVG
jgi:Bacterial Ig-like domain (group 3)